MVNNNKKKAFISGDNIVKHIQDWEITKKRDKKQEVYVRQFSSSQVSCMKDYVRQLIRENNPDHIIFNVGTNDVSSEKTPQVIAQSIVDLVKSATNDNLQETVSSIIPRNEQWSKKVNEVNKVSLNLCKDVNILFIEIDAKKIINNDNLQLNIKCSRKLQENFNCQVFETFF